MGTISTVSRRIDRIEYALERHIRQSEWSDKMKMWVDDWVAPRIPRILREVIGLNSDGFVPKAYRL